MLQFVTLLPTSYNDGSRVADEERQGILDEALVLFGGYSLEGPIQGAWRDEASGEVHDDMCYRLIVGFQSTQLNQGESFVLRAGQRLKQKAMWFELRDTDTRILRIPESEHESDTV